MQSAVQINGDQFDAGTGVIDRELLGRVAVRYDGKPRWDRPFEVQLIDLSQLRYHPLNPRTYTSFDGLLDLRDKIAAQGVLNPIVICRSPEEGEGLILSGNRRRAACEMAGRNDAPCILEARNLSESEARKLLILYNEHYLDLPPVDCARQWAAFMTSAGLSKAQLAVELGVKPDKVRAYLSLLALPEEIQDSINKGKVSIMTGRALSNPKLSYPDKITIARRAADEGLAGLHILKLINEKIGSGKNRDVPSHPTKPRNKQETSREHWLVHVPSEVTVTMTSGKVKLGAATILKALSEATRQFVPSLEMPDHHLKESSAYMMTGQHKMKIERCVRDLFVNAKQYALEQNGDKCPAAYYPDAVSYAGKPRFDRAHEKQMISLSNLRVNPYYTRRVESKEDGENLASSLAEEGVREAFVIAPGKEDGTAYIVDGHRRARILLSQGVSEVPCILDPNCNTEQDHRRALIAFQANRLKPDPIDRAKSYLDYMKCSGATEENFARCLGIKPARLRGLLRLLSLSPAAQRLVRTGVLSEACAREIAQSALPPELKERVAVKAAAQRHDTAGVKRLINSQALALATKQPLSALRLRNKTDISTVVLGNNRVEVRVCSEEAVLSPEQIRQALEHVRRTVLGEASQEFDKTSLPSLKRGRSIEGAVPGWDSTMLTAVRALYPELVGIFKGKISVTPELAKILFLECDIEELHLLGVSTSPKTQINVLQWLDKLSEPLPAIRPIELITYWQWCKERINSHKGNLISKDDILNLPLDVKTSNRSGGVGVSTAMAEIRVNMNSISSLSLDNMLRYAEGRGAVNLNAEKTAKSDRLVAREELSSAGIILGPNFWRFFKEVMAANGVAYKSTNYMDEGGLKLSLLEYQSYCFHCMSALVKNNTRLTSGFIGRAQLDFLKIAYGGTTPDILRIPTLEVIDMYHKNLSGIAYLIEK